MISAMRLRKSFLVSQTLKISSHSPTYFLILFLLCSWERHFSLLSLAWSSWQAVLNFNDISIKLQADGNILVSLEAGRVIACLMY